MAYPMPLTKVDAHFPDRNSFLRELVGTGSAIKKLKPLSKLQRDLTSVKSVILRRVSMEKLRLL